MVVATNRSYCPMLLWLRHWCQQWQNSVRAVGRANGKWLKPDHLAWTRRETRTLRASDNRVCLHDGRNAIIAGRTNVVDIRTNSIRTAQKYDNALRRRNFGPAATARSWPDPDLSDYVSAQCVNVAGGPFLFVVSVAYFELEKSFPQPRYGPTSVRFST